SNCTEFCCIKVSFTAVFPQLSQFLITGTEMTWEQAIPIRLLYCCWMLGAIVLTNAYSCSFYSTLTLSMFEPLADTVEDLIRIAEVDPSRIYVRQGANNVKLLFQEVKQDSGLLYTLGLHLNR